MHGDYSLENLGMRENLPVFDREFDYPADELLMSTTDSRGHITHCNAAFERVSGYSMQELMGQSHNMVRHPDMPSEAFRDMWATIGHGRSWKGMVKNRRKDGSFYWVEAHVTPIMQNGKPVGYMSVRASLRANRCRRRRLYMPSLMCSEVRAIQKSVCTLVTFAALGGATSWENCSALAFRLEWLG